MIIFSSLGRGRPSIPPLGRITRQSTDCAIYYVSSVGFVKTFLESTDMVIRIDVA